MSNFMNNQNYFDDDDPLNSTGVSKRSLVLFFLIDVSGSMKGTKIGELNTAMEELIPEALSNDHRLIYIVSLHLGACLMPITHIFMV